MYQSGSGTTARTRIVSTNDTGSTAAQTNEALRADRQRRANQAIHPIGKGVEPVALLAGDELGTVGIEQGDLLVRQLLILGRLVAGDGGDDAGPRLD